MERDLFQEIGESLDKRQKDYMESIKNKVVNLYKLAIATTVYSIPENENGYHRTYQLINSVKGDIVDGTLYVYHDLKGMGMHYYSYLYDDIETTEQVPYWVNYGHGGLWLYGRRNFLEVARDVVRQEFGVEVVIMNDEPKWINFP
jgi:hypothetical protein